MHVTIDVISGRAFLDPDDAWQSGVDPRIAQKLDVEGAAGAAFVYLCHIPSVGQFVFTDPAEIEACALAFAGAEVRMFRVVPSRARKTGALIA